VLLLRELATFVCEPSEMANRYPRFRQAKLGCAGRRNWKLRRSIQQLATGVVGGAALGVAAMTPLGSSHLNSFWDRLSRTPAEIQAVERSVYYRSCNEARVAGAAPIYRGSPGYRGGMDGDSDGIACEPYRGRW
jgi:hypothetical protein